MTSDFSIKKKKITREQLTELFIFIYHSYFPFLDSKQLRNIIRSHAPKYCLKKQKCNSKKQAIRQSLTTLFNMFE